MLICKYICIFFSLDGLTILTILRRFIANKSDRAGKHCEMRALKVKYGTSCKVLESELHVITVVGIFAQKRMKVKVHTCSLHLTGENTS